MNQQPSLDPTQHRDAAPQQTSRTASPRSLHEHRTDRWSAKAWIQPDGTATLIDSLHYRWILKHGKQLTEQFGLDLNDVPKREEPIRIAAVRAGFFRVNYKIATGSITFEGLKSRLSPKVREALFTLGEQSIGRISDVNIHLFDDEVRSAIFRGTENLAAIEGINQKLVSFDQLLVAASNS